MTSPDDDGDALADALEGKTSGTISTETIKPRRIESEALDDLELLGMTFHGTDVSVQVRVYGRLTEPGQQDVALAMVHHQGAPRGREAGRPWEVRELDVIKLRDLLNEATRRGLLP